MKIIKSNVKYNKISIDDISNKVSTGATPSTKNNEFWEFGNINWMSSGEVNKKIVTFVDKKITKKGLESISNKMFPINTIMMALAGQGKTKGTVALTKIKTSCNQSLAAIEVNDSQNPYTVYKQLDLMYKKIRGIVGEGREGLNIKTVKSLIINDIKKTEQDKIASVLSQQEEQVNKIKSLIEKLEKRNQYYAERLLSGELRVREGADGEIEFYENEEWKEIKVGNKIKLIPTTWNKDVLGNLVSVTTGKKNANAGSEDGLYKFFTCSKEDKLINSYSFDQEAILIAGNGIVGLSKYYNGKFDAYQRTYVLGDFKINGKYLYSFINKKFQKAIEKEIKGGVISYIKLENINDFEVLYPSNNSELELLMDTLNNLNTELSQVEKLLKKEQKRFDWMSDALLSGEYQIVD